MSESFQFVQTATENYPTWLASKGWNKVPEHSIGSSDEQRKARLELLAKEKELTKLRDEVARMRQKLPWVKVEIDYEFKKADGSIVRLSQLFDDSKPVSDLIVQHFMFGTDWDRGCGSCSAWADNLNGILHHLLQKANVAIITKAPLEQVGPFVQKKGWKLPFYSSFSSTFNRDFGVEFTPEEGKERAKLYNYGYGSASPVLQYPGISIFRKKDGVVYHTYSTYARGLEPQNAVWAYLDLLPDGRGTFICRHPDLYPSPGEKQAAGCAHCSCDK